MMRNHPISRALLAATLSLCAGCAHLPGKPVENTEPARPEQITDFHVLYQQNCAGCHGDNGRGGAAIPLNNPAYLAFAGAQNLRTATAKGVSSTMMPAFAASAGGMLTDRQIDALVEGMLRAWARPSEFAGAALPPYSAAAAASPADGQKAYTAACARCHGADGAGIRTNSPTSTGVQVPTPHSIVDPSYLALVNDQSLRSYIIAGHLDVSAPDWRSYIPGRPLTDQEITGIVAWLAAHRTPVAQQSINTPRTTPPGVAKDKP